MKQKQSERHGGGISAPDEPLFIDDSPTPVGVVARGRRPSARPVPAGGTWSRLGALLKVFLGLVIVAGASAAVAFSIHRYTLSTSRFALRELSVSGNERLSKGEVQALAGIELEKNLFSLDTRAAEARLLQNPWIASARLTRELPSRLEIELVERRAVALAALGSRLYLVTEDGEPFKEVTAEDPVDLPVVTGVTAADLGRDRAGAVERIRLGVDLLKKYETLPLSKHRPAQEVSSPLSGHVALTVGKDGITLALGRPPFAQKLVMAADVVGSLARKGRTPGIVFLDNEAHPERVVVRMK